ncbi:Fic family protein [Scytonema millei]|uniref:Fic family protein n=1 Tax=Scytonema millei VB511283 TaxID=1245923 RepID=A0A9X5E8F6_9CYAN|nr:Fic family protein [Scytonema millei]NHC35952.1 Fic family protein [Scytonema millei VB511283]
MNSFFPGSFERQPITQNLLRTIRLIGEYKGKQELFKQQSPQVLETLQLAAIIQSTESSNRIEGVVAPLQRILALVAQKTTPMNRSEQEIAGYRDVLDTIHANYERMPFNTGLVLQLHRDLYRFLPGSGGQWKSADNKITETRPDGTTAVRFEPVSAFLTPTAMAQLHERFNTSSQADEVEPLLLIPTYVLDFLCIHPFRDGNGRMARLLTLLLLYQAGYEVGRYISLEQIVERTRESYYDTLYQSSVGWHDRQHTLLPWWEYFLGVVLAAYREFEQRVGTVTASRGAKREIVLDVVARLPNQFQYADVERACPGVSRPTINRALAELRESGQIRCIKPGRDAVWEKTRSLRD